MTGVLTLPELALAALEWRREGAVLVLACGCFDPLHVGHVQHLKAARGLGNVLVVAVTGDGFVNKGPNRPRSPAEHRAEVVASLSCVDAAVVNDSATAGRLIHLFRPHVFVKGAEYQDNKTPNLIEETELVERFGGRVAYLSGRVVCSSTAILAGA